MIEVDKNESAILFIGGEQNGTWNNKTWISITSLKILNVMIVLKFVAIEHILALKSCIMEMFDEIPK